MSSYTIVISAALLAIHATTYAALVHAFIDDLEKYEIHKLSTYSHMNNARNGRKLMQSKGMERLSYEFEAFGRVLSLDLTRDDELFASDYKHYFVVPKDDGSHDYVVDEQADTKCHYRATIKDDSQSRGRVSLCGPGMRALLQHSEIGQFHIQPMNDEGDEHAVYRALDIKKSSKRKCGVDDKKSSPGLKSVLVDDNDNIDNLPFVTVNGPANDVNHDHDHEHQDDEGNGDERRILGNGPNKLIRMLIVNDNMGYKQKGNSVHSNSAQVIAAMDTLYAGIGGSYTFDIQIVSMFTFAMKDPFTVTIQSTGYPTANNLLDLFTTWMRAKGANFPVDFSAAMMLSGYNFDGSTIGLAWVGTACNANSKSSVVQTYGYSDAIVAATAAHELGHNLGMRHDDVYDTNSLVPNACYDASVPHIMDPSVSADGKAPWSTCSPNWVKMQLEGYGSYSKRYDVSGYPSCMEKCFIGDPNPPAGCTPVATWTQSPPVCGDGLVEGNEQCDCPNKDCTNIDPCCDGATCKLKSTSQCSAADPCCNSCQIVTDTTKVCRAAVGECDFSETCNGVSSKCPTDTFKDLGVACTAASKPGICYNKECRSHWKMCNQINPSQFDDDCNWRDDDDGDAACGPIYCHSTGSTSGSCTYYPTIPVENGTPCAAGKACLNQVCTAYTSFPSQPTSSPTSGTSVTASPTNKPVTKAPSKAPITKAPTRNPVTTSPTPQTVTSNPTRNPITVSPTNKPVTKAPTRNPVTSSPTPQTVTSNPTRNPVTNLPTNKPVTKAPSKAPITKAPTNNPVTTSPTTQTVTSIPTNKPVTKAPSKAPVTKAPTNNPVTTSPTPQAVTSSPTTKVPTKNPTAKPTNFPVSKIPTRSPTSACLYVTKSSCRAQPTCKWLSLGAFSRCVMKTKKQ